MSGHYEQYPKYDFKKQAQLAWATERPVKLKVSVHCQGCCWKLDEDLRDLEGVHDVGMSGWSDAEVTVTGMALRNDILTRARKSANHAEYCN